MTAASVAGNSSPEPSAKRGVCCPVANCTRIRINQEQGCPCGGTRNIVESASCSDPLGSCSTVEFRKKTCFVNGFEFNCEESFPGPACGPPTPSPTDTPPPPTPQYTGLPPNPKNCECKALDPANPTWACFCLDDTPANYFANSPTGCPYGTYNDGDDCCIPYPSGCSEGCEGDVPDGGLQTDFGPCPCASPVTRGWRSTATAAGRLTTGASYSATTRRSRRLQRASRATASSRSPSSTSRRRAATPTA